MTKKNEPPTSLRELVRFDAAKEALDGALDSLKPLIEEYNDSLEQADAAVRGRGVSMGHFKITREFDEFDPDKLFELVGRDKFLEWGGTEKIARELSVDKTKLRSFIAAGKVPKAVVDQILTRKRQYSTPKPLKLT